MNDSKLSVNVENSSKFIWDIPDFTRDPFKFNFYQWSKQKMVAGTFMKAKMIITDFFDWIRNDFDSRQTG